MNPPKSIPLPPGAVFWVRAATIVGVVALLGVSQPLIGAAVHAGLGLLALAGMGVAAVALMQAVPLSMQKLENRLLAARRREARANPVEQLHNECLRREQRLESFRSLRLTMAMDIRHPPIDPRVDQT